MPKVAVHFGGGEYVAVQGDYDDVSEAVWQADRVGDPFIEFVRFDGEPVSVRVSAICLIGSQVEFKIEKLLEKEEGEE